MVRTIGQITGAVLIGLAVAALILQLGHRAALSLAIAGALTYAGFRLWPTREPALDVDLRPAADEAWQDTWSGREQNS